MTVTTDIGVLGLVEEHGGYRIAFTIGWQPSPVERLAKALSGAGDTVEVSFVGVAYDLVAFAVGYAFHEMMILHWRIAFSGKGLYL